jgi:hypothetical protein
MTNPAPAKPDGEHTPLPWRNDQKPDALIVCDAEGGSIADCAPPGPWMSHKVALANAALIVRAVNSYPRYEQMREALEAISHDMYDGRPTPAAKRARKALADGTGE